MGRLLLGAACLLSGCVDADIAHLFLKTEGATSAAPLASNSRTFRCVVAI